MKHKNIYDTKEFEEFKSNFDDDTPISEIKREYKLYYVPKPQVKKFEGLRITNTQREDIRRGDTFNVVLSNGTNLQMQKQGSNLIVFSNSDRDVKRLVKEFGEHNLLRETDTNFLQVLPDKNKPLIKRNLKPQSVVREHKRTGTRGVRRHVRRNRK